MLRLLGCGYIPGGQNFSELLIGEEKGEQLWFIKRLIAGFVPHSRAAVFEAIKGLKASKCPFANLPERRKSPHALTAEVMRQCVWVNRNAAAKWNSWSAPKAEDCVMWSFGA